MNSMGRLYLVSIQMRQVGARNGMLPGLENILEGAQAILSVLAFLDETQVLEDVKEKRMCGVCVPLIFVPLIRQR